MKQMMYRGIELRPERLHGLGITERQAMNMVDLVDLLRRAPPPRFHMGYWTRLGVGRSVTSTGETASSPASTRAAAVQGHECGTVCCALGTAAFHGIGIDPEEELPALDKKGRETHEQARMSNESFDRYAERVFGVMGAAGSLGGFLFSNEWVRRDNTAAGAAARLLYLLASDVERFRLYAVRVKDYAPMLGVPVEPLSSPGEPG